MAKTYAHLPPRETGGSGKHVMRETDKMTISVDAGTCKSSQDIRWM